jgi:tripartite-type tricarboxylate transporter receptor subunit TctC
MIRIIHPCAAALLAFACSVAMAQGAFPSKPVRMVVAYPPGGPVDIVGRALAQPLSESLGQPVVVDNRAGAGGVVGTEFVARAAPDGYTILFTSTPLAIQESLFAKLPYSALKDFTLIGGVAAGPQMLVVGTSIPANNVRELIALAKAQPGKLNYASPSSGGANHLAAEMFKSMAGIDAVHVPYKGGAPAELDLLGGRVTFMFHSLPAAMQQVRAGRLRALAVTSRNRVAMAPDVPTVAEFLPDFEVTSWYAVVGPAGMPADVVSRLNADLNKAIRGPAMKDRMASQGIEPIPGTPEQYAEFLRREIAKWAKVVKESGAKAD